MLRIIRTALVCLLAVLPARAMASGPTAQAAPPPPQTAANVDETILQDARRYFDSLDYERAVAALDIAIGVLQARPASDAAARHLLVSAYEMRARSRFGMGNQAGASEDFQALLRLAPQFRLSAKVSPRVVTLLEDMRKIAVGQIVLTVSPEDAALQLDGAPWAFTQGTIPLGAGAHTITAERPGYRPLSLPFTVPAGASQDLAVTLERVSASLSFVVSPADVEVFVNGVSRGRTEPMPVQEAGELAAQLKVPPTAVSKRFVIADLPAGAHTLELKRDCYTNVERRIAIEKLLDYRLEPLKLEPAVATVRVSSPAPGAAVFLDDTLKGSAPTSLTDVCEGPHVVEVRSPYGRFVKRLNLKAGDKATVEGTPKPAFAILSVSGLPEGLRGAADVRLAAERALGGTSSVLLFAPSAERSEQVLRSQGLGAGWLAFDKLKRPIGDVASNIAPQARQELSAQIAKTLDVQGLAAVTVLPGADRNDVLVSLLASGSSEPDVIELKVDSPESAARAQAQLDVAMQLLRPSIGLVAIDILDSTGPVVARVDKAGPAAAAGLSPGDTIVAANGKPVPDVGALTNALTSLAPDARLMLDTKDRAGLAKRPELKPVLAARALALTDQTVLFNKHLLDLRYRLASAGSTPEEPVVRQNIAIALMRLGNWTDARAELDKVRLPDGPGVSGGTIQYLVGLCYEAAGQFGEAEKAWALAAQQKEAILSEDGPLITEMAAAKLDRLKKARGSQSPRPN